MKKERAEKELQKVRAQLEELKEREKNLVECIREAEKNETAEIMEIIWDPCDHAMFLRRPKCRRGRSGPFYRLGRGL